MSNEVMTTDVQEVTTAELVSEARTSDTRAVSEQREPLFPADEAERFRSDWSGIQGSFVDEPRQSVEKADALVSKVTERLAEVFTGERDRLEGAWAQGNDVSTEDLRQALRRYRSFFDRLLSI